MHSRYSLSVCKDSWNQHQYSIEGEGFKEKKKIQRGLWLRNKQVKKEEGGISRVARGPDYWVSPLKPWEIQPTIARRIA